MHAIAAPARVCLTRPPLASTASRRHRRGAVIVPNAALYPRDDDADGKRTWGQAIGVLAVPLGIHALITITILHQGLMGHMQFSIALRVIRVYCFGHPASPICRSIVGWCG